MTVRETLCDLVRRFGGSEVRSELRSVIRDEVISDLDHGASYRAVARRHGLSLSDVVAFSRLV